MCGLIGSISNTSEVNNVLDSLEKLEYRGYDSSGIAYIKNQQITIIKDTIKIEKLKDLIFDNTSPICIGHTRWATHGNVSKENAHPHLSSSSKFALVHNGIIENYKQTYLKDYRFYSQTDSEVLLNLIEQLSNQYSILETLYQVQKIIKGSYAICLINKDEEKIYFIKNKTPLIIGKGMDTYSLSSDVDAFNIRVESYYYLDDHMYGYITSTSSHVYQNNIEIKPSFSLIGNIKQDINKGKYSTFREKEIHEQPLLIDKLINNYLPKDNILFSSSIKYNLLNSDKIYLVACGSSFYASKIGKIYLQNYLKKDVEVLLASEALYAFPLLSKNPYFIFASQSGETLDVLNLVKICKKKNIKTLGLVNSYSSSLERMCDDSINVLAGKEISVASTKAFFNQCLIYLFLSKINNTKSLKSDLFLLKNNLINILDLQDKIKELALKIKDKKDVYFIGRNQDYIIALEAALKLKEISYIHAEGFPSGELKHGSIALLDKNSVVIALISNEKTASITRVNLQESSSREATCYTFSNKSLSKNNDYIINDDLPTYLSFFNNLITCQLLALYCATYKGNNVDKPRNLAKSVTVE